MFPIVIQTKLNTKRNNYMKEWSSPFTEPTRHTKNVKAYRYCLHAFIKYFTEDQPRELTKDDVKNYLLQVIVNERLATSTVSQMDGLGKYLQIEFL